MSPLRADRRPVLGVLHATVVSARVVAAMREISASAGDECAEVSGEVASRVMASVHSGTTELLPNGELTESGKALVYSFHQQATAC